MKRNLGLAGSMALLVACSGSPDSLIGDGTGSGGVINGGAADGSGGGTTGTPGATTTSGTTAGSSFVPSPTTPVGDGGECEVFKVQAERSAPDMLIVMDASGSMVGFGGIPGLDDITDPNFWTGGGMGGLNRWDPAVAAVNSLVGQLEQSIQFGLMIFPAGAMGCNAGDLDVPMGVMNAQPIASALANTMPLTGATPTSLTLSRAREVLATREPVIVGGPEGFPLPQYVLLVTDGDPNCVDVPNPTGGEVDTGAQQASIAEIEALAQMNVKTYVVGIDTADSSFASVLDQMAVAGATGDTAHRSVNSGSGADALIQEFQAITSNAVSCSFVLSQNVDPSKVIVYLDGEPAEYGVDWVIEDDMRTVNLIDGGCNALQLGATLEAQVVCEVVNII